MLIAIISISINAFVLSSLTDKYFKEYIAENYEIHFNQIIEYSQKALSEDDLSYNQMNMEMETHLIDPITRIKLYNYTGELIVDVSIDNTLSNNSMMSGMMRKHYTESEQEIDSVELVEDGRVIGQLNITRYSSIENSIARRMFKSSLILNSIYAILIVLLITLFIGMFVVKKMSKDLINSAKMAQNIDLGVDTILTKTKIREISTIQQSLDSLRNRLKLKNKSRKVLIDELVHQTRTPLTILKTHLEGFSDDIIQMTPDEIKVCEDQIENITEIISNMSHMIDAQNDYDKVKLEKFELNAVLKQIVNGLKTQFDKKKIKLQLSGDNKIMLNSDRYKLSQIIYNILTNAYRYTSENGYVKISYDIESEFIIIRIEDNGEGISDKDIDKIFDAYYHGTTRFENNGEGLGLYFVKENLEKIHGKINVTSKVNEGSKFTISLPKNMVNSKSVW